MKFTAPANLDDADRLPHRKPKGVELEERRHEGNFFEDFEIGQIIEHRYARTITEGDVAIYMALTGDRFPAYCDREFAQRLGFRREIVNDLLVFNIIYGKSVPDISLNAPAQLGFADVQFETPVYVGDTLRSVSHIFGKKENSGGETGTLYVHTRGLNQDRATVVHFFRWMPVRKRDAATRTNEDEVLSYPETADSTRLFIPEDIRNAGVWSALETAPTFESYEPGQRFYHGAGTPIEDAENALAARLYQINAAPHAPAAKDMPAGRRVVYGGHVISVARALSFNGFEGVLRILAWNSGVYPNPVFGGDTVYAFTDVLDKVPIAGRDDLGALRLRLVAVKNQDPSNRPLEVKLPGNGAAQGAYDDSVVLDLDYYVLIAKDGVSSE